MTLFAYLQARYRANTKLLNTLGCFAVASLIHNKPWVIAFLPPHTQDQIQTGVSYFLENSVMLVLLWAKQHNSAGDGSKEDPLRKVDAAGTVTLIPAPKPA